MRMLAEQDELERDGVLRAEGEPGTSQRARVWRSGSLRRVVRAVVIVLAIGAGLTYAVLSSRHGVSESRRVITGGAATAAGPVYPRESVLKDVRCGLAFKRVDRLDVKLMTWGDLRSALYKARLVVEVPSLDLNRRVWVVAGSGEVNPVVESRLLPRPPSTWAVVIEDSSTGKGLAQITNSEGTWPPYFDELPDQWTGDRGSSPTAC
jgi:hypothetical protein